MHQCIFCPHPNLSDFTAWNFLKMQRTCHSLAWSLLLRTCRHANTSHTNATPLYYFGMSICLKPFTVPTNHSLYEKSLKNFSNANAFPTSTGMRTFCVRTLSVTNFMLCELNLIRTFADELLLTNLLQYELFPLRTLACDTFVYKLCPLQTFWIRTFSITNFFFHYDLLPLRTFHHTNIIPCEHLHTKPRLLTFFYTNLMFTNFRPFTKLMSLIFLFSNFSKKQGFRFSS